MDWNLYLPRRGASITASLIIYDVKVSPALKSFVILINLSALFSYQDAIKNKFSQTTVLYIELLMQTQLNKSQRNTYSESGRFFFLTILILHH